MKKRTVAIFEGKHIRRVWDGEKELWYFSIVDVIQVLTDSPNPRSYWKVLKFRLKEEGSEVVTKCNQLKMEASDGTKRRGCIQLFVQQENCAYIFPI